jgi:hypothetical protein
VIMPQFNRLLALSALMNLGSVLPARAKAPHSLCQRASAISAAESNALARRNPHRSHRAALGRD